VEGEDWKKQMKTLSFSPGAASAINAIAMINDNVSTPISRPVAKKLRKMCQKIVPEFNIARGIGML
jgi:hypothetical protein